MLTLTVLLQLMSTMLFYKTSKRVSNARILPFIPKSTSKLWQKGSAAALFIASLFLFIYSLGVSSGIISGVLSFLCVLSLTVILNPLKYIRFRHLITLCLILFYCEYFLF